MAEYPHLSEIPMGLGMALMQNKAAMDYYSGLPEEAKQRIIDHTHTIQSKEEMQMFVDSLGSGK
ncbi:MAG: hypothetical protein FWE91_06395 [Defluviitaleaceae bacterium]|nr:hypothetical protein [Defluviitaleaceae bacterium]MCL2836315.1 hypothetical protein [Defluviitaleaceae bacterium]